MWTAIVIGVVVILVGIGYTIWGMRRIGTPTKGAKIDLAERTGSALLIIDMQRDFTELVGEKTWTPQEVQSVIAKINQRAAAAREAGWPVLTIRQVYEGAYTNFLVRLLGKGLGAKGSDGLGLDPRIAVGADADFVKPMADSFSSSSLDDFLRKKKIGHLELTGLDGIYCVKSTAHGALNRGYKVTLDTDAILASSEEAWRREKEKLASKGAILTAASGSPL